jgi:hypothetical protein
MQFLDDFRVCVLERVIEDSAWRFTWEEREDGGVRRFFRVRR